MVVSPEIKACKGCAAAKRKCGKQKPSCLRCRARQIPCTYPPPKPSSFVRYEDDTSSVEREAVSYGTSLQTAFPPSLPNPGSDQPLPSNRRDASENSLIGTTSSACWFTSPETWTIHRFPPAEQRSFSIPELKRYVRVVFHWLEQWVETSSNPFIHAELYRNRFPRCIQDAYTALSSYFHRQSSNEHMVFRIIADRAEQLVRENGTGQTLTDPLDHLARVHALLVYQYLGLYDGDIRMRHLAERHIPVVNRWIRQMVDHASQDVCLGEALVSPASRQPTAGFTLSDMTHSENLPWYSWILAESTRRTYMIGSGMQAIYLTLRQGCAPPCQGSMVFTSRSGIWDAQSAPAWEKRVLETNARLVATIDSDQLFSDTKPEDVDDFANFSLDVTYGGEMMERWRARIEG